VKLLINALGYKVLDPLVHTTANSSVIDEQVLYIKIGNASASGCVTYEGFVVHAEAIINEKISEKSLSPGIMKLRTKLITEGKVKDLKTTEDILFSSSSAAADFILGYSVSGPRTWKATDGRSLKDLESETDA